LELKRPVPPTFNTEEMVEEPVMAKLVPVALPKVRKPESVVEAENREVVVPFVAKNLSKVEEAEYSEVEVALPKMAPAVALNAPVIVEEPVIASEEVVPLEREKIPPVMRPVFDMENKVVVESPTVEDAMAKRERLVLEAAWRMVKLA
jgi:hypothetical protein